MKGKVIDKLKYFTLGEWILWASSVIVIIVTYFVFHINNYITLAGSIVGVTSLIFCAKGNPIGQALMIVFSILYAINSYKFAYYGEMITYLGMTAPMAVLSLISWLGNPYKGDKKQVKINKIKGKEILFAFGLTVAVTVAFYFILKALKTANLIISTISVATSFFAVYFTFRRSPLHSVGYALNDIVLIIMWIMATLEDKGYLSTVICFAVFLINDIYILTNWLRLRKKQVSGDTRDSIQDNENAEKNEVLAEETNETPQN